MQKNKKSSGFLDIISKMNSTAVRAVVPSASTTKTPTPKIMRSEPRIGASGSVSELDIGLIEPSGSQPRKSFDETALKELAASIAVHGVIQPIIVTKVEGRFVIVAGERRYRAAKAAGIKRIPVIVKEVTRRGMSELSLIENIQREELNAIEEAEAMRILLEEYNLTQEELAASLGKSRPAVANGLRLLKLPNEVIELVRSGALTAGHARALLSLKDSALQIKYAKEAILKKISVRGLESRIDKANTVKTLAQAARQSPELKAMEKLLQRTFATKVKISGNDDKGKILIEYYSKGELQKIYELLEELND